MIIEHVLDEDGKPLVLIPLTQNKIATLRQDEFNELIELGLDPRLRFSQGQVLTRGAKPISVARLVADAKASQQVKMKDGDVLNLRRSNLLSVQGGSKSNARDHLKPNNKYTLLKERGELQHKFNNPERIQ